MRGVILDTNEHVVRIFHQSKWVLAKPFILSLVAIVGPWWYVSKLSIPRAGTLLVVWTILICVYFLREYKLWMLQKYVITSKRLIKHHHDALFKKVVVETPLDRILNVSFKTTGLFSVIGRFGDVEVQVVGLIEPMILKHITHPANIKEYLWRAHAEAGKQSGFDAPHLQEKIGYTKQNQRIL
jgi:hypothetical protein